MLRTTLWVLVGVFVTGRAFCSITCRDGTVCPDSATCCRTKQGYGCCPYPKATCCADLASCCPYGYRCNLVTKMCQKENQPWLSIPMVKKDAAQEPSTPELSAIPLDNPNPNGLVPDQKSSVVHCDALHYCPDRTTCCRHPTGVWFCCPYYPGRCCLDGYHCCPYGYDCDLSYTHCIRQSLWYPFTAREALASVPASVISPVEDKSSVEEKPLTALTEASGGLSKPGVIRCDSRFYCPQTSTCCQGPNGQWNCCPYPLGTCCADGKHCCEYGYTCDPSAATCRRGIYEIPFRPQEPAYTD
ncbi:progranulin-like [Mugil cephalus]|uniref:progranulin-like n=1 Tax=Mugil cephalus TaxID=48193 RepID=UPI001FB6C654|nr:progranulin-like [Mugil cephalus]XP_047460087.1 progranulin-like [Mugil cephalus]